MSLFQAYALGFFTFPGVVLIAVAYHLLFRREDEGEIW